VPPQQSEFCAHGEPSGRQPPPELPPLPPLLLLLPPLLPLPLPLLLLPPPAPHVPLLVSQTPLQQSEFCTQKEPSGAQLPPELLPLPLPLPVLPPPPLPLLLPPPLDDPPEPEPPRVVFVPDELPFPLPTDPSVPPSSPVVEEYEVVGVGPPDAHPFAAAITRQSSAASIPINNLELMSTWPSGAGDGTVERVPK
jgi:hypothetical protein